MVQHRVTVCLLALVLVSGCATRDSFPAPRAEAQAPAVAVASDPRRSYLPPEQLARLGAETPQAPAPGSAGEAADRAYSERLTGWADTPRWTLAQTHAEVSPALALAHFDCPLGTRLSQEPPPALVRLFTRALRDASIASTAAKNRAFRARPFADDPSRATCIRTDESLRGSASHPSGHATVGALYGMIMGDVAPDVAEEMYRRGREIGFSRAVCGLHYPADVDAGQALGYEIYRALMDLPEYQADLAEARREVAEARTKALRNPGCAAERAALAQELS
ncbi:phosphatase PAP2 family protein [Brevundimonas sp. 2R-24]|uniref:Acid phosphatase n=1 Tax=Peiella sedimenti TaxID=3061083 RepID=A0ABT8SLP4_9CAUL|nr:phosphatase PAP2 family protein [Caulobacteraceae bacterium XZ-24]